MKELPTLAFAFFIGGLAAVIGTAVFFYVGLSVLFWLVDYFGPAGGFMLLAGVVIFVTGGAVVMSYWGEGDQV